MKENIFSLTEEIESTSLLWLAEKRQIRKNRGTVLLGVVLAGPAIMIGLCSLNLRIGE
jgi:hypothetical protein